MCGAFLFLSGMECIWHSPTKASSVGWGAKRTPRIVRGNCAFRRYFPLRLFLLFLERVELLVEFSRCATEECEERGNFVTRPCQARFRHCKPRDRVGVILASLCIVDSHTLVVGC